MEIFCAVIDEESFSRAAVLLNSKPSTVSKAITQLELELGIKLLARTTRSLSITEPGQYFYDEACLILARVKAIKNRLIDNSAVPSGRLKITATNLVGQFYLTPLVIEFNRLYPEISIELIYTDEYLDYVANDIDIGIRSTMKLEDSSYFSVKLCSAERVLVASTEYLRIHGIPQSPAELMNHKCLIFRAAKIYNKWGFIRNKTLTSIATAPYLISNSYATLAQAAREGMGIANAFSYLVKNDLEKNKLQLLLSDYAQVPQNLFAIYTVKRSSSTKLDMFLSFLEKNPVE